jgi:ferredoxin-fold anticodon binding domain-containing protein
MSKILLSEPKGPYSGTLDTEVMDVTITEVYTGVGFVTQDEEYLSICMRDNGYELMYNARKSEKDVFVELKGGDVYINGRRVYLGVKEE